ncbi:S-norcoclaurine synthase 1 [Spatholobus suberectus]|nr:S-norcoclaurine synthase 1 [Spatholobus suberectus]
MLGQPCKGVVEIGCSMQGVGFLSVNHGVQKELLQKMKDAASEFFELPTEEKNKCAMASNDIHGYGQPYYVVFEEQTLEWSDALMLTTYPTRYRKLQFWPKTPEGFKFHSEPTSVISAVINSTKPANIFSGLSEKDVTFLYESKPNQLSARFEIRPPPNKSCQIGLQCGSWKWGHLLKREKPRS